MAVTHAEVGHIARLARLRLDDAAVERLTREMNGILEHVDALRALEATGDDIRVRESGTPLRADVADPDPLHRAPAELAPGWAEGFFTVPRLEALDGA